MSFTKDLYFKLLSATPSQLATAIAHAFDAGNGAGRTFEARDLSYTLPGDIGFSSDKPKLSDLHALQSFPADFSLTVMAERAGDPQLTYLKITTHAARLNLYVSSETPEAITRFANAFQESLKTVPTVSSLDELASDISDLATDLRGRDRSASETTSSAERTDPRTDRNAPARVLIFTALQEERELLQSEFGLSTTYEDNVARGVRHGVAVEVISARRIGRVAAAVSVSAHLAKSSYTYELIVVAGIAGGFVEAGIYPGAIVIATDVVDLATRKQHEEDTEFRPGVYATDDSVSRFLQSSLFDKSSWEHTLVRDDSWPEGRRPYIKYGPLASTDEVVSSDDWRRKLIEAWPKLLGTEMEAGGACAAAEQFGRKVAVVRGVSDLADPRKADDEWRKRSMRAVISILDRMLLSGVVKRQA